MPSTWHYDKGNETADREDRLATDMLEKLHACVHVHMCVCVCVRVCLLESTGTSLKALPSSGQFSPSQIILSLDKIKPEKVAATFVSPSKQQPLCRVRQPALERHLNVIRWSSHRGN